MLLRKTLRWTAVAVATAVTLCLVVFGLLQTGPGKDFLGPESCDWPATRGSLGRSTGSAGPCRST